MIEIQSEIPIKADSETGTGAGVDISGHILRYAAVESYQGQQRRLLRLGHCDFDFQAADTIYRGNGEEDLQVMAEALHDAFAGENLEQLNFIVHPPDCYSFFTPVPIGFSDKEARQRFQEEASLLVQKDVSSVFHLSGQALYEEEIDEERVRWFHVLGIKDSIWERLQIVLEGVPVDRFQAMLSMQGAGRILTHEEKHSTDQASSPNVSHSIAIGWYPNHVEFSVCQGGEWRFGHFSSVGSSTDCAYFAVALLNRINLKPQNVNRLRLYGNQVDVTQFELLERIFGVQPLRLSAMPLFDADTESFTMSFDPEAYAACLGAAL